MVKALLGAPGEPGTILKGIVPAVKSRIKKSPVEVLESFACRAQLRVDGWQQPVFLKVRRKSNRSFSFSALTLSSPAAQPLPMQVCPRAILGVTLLRGCVDPELGLGGSGSLSTKLPP